MRHTKPCWKSPSLAVRKQSVNSACDVCVGTGEIISLWTQVPGGETLRCFMCLGSGKQPTPSRGMNHTPLNWQVSELQPSMGRMEETGPTERPPFR